MHFPSVVFRLWAHRIETIVEACLFSFNKMDKKESETIKVLEGDKFPVWRFHMELCFKEKALLLITNGTTPKPGDNAPEAEKLAWEKADTIAQRMISSSVSIPILENLVNCTSAASMWSTLCSLYQ